MTESGSGPAPYAGSIIDRSRSRGHGDGRSEHGGRGNGEDHSNPRLALSFDGLNLRDQRLANGGNQFTVEPPDQGLCAGNGFVVESVNDVIRVFHADGTPATGVTDLNSFYGYPAQFNRTTGDQGPFVTDPSCYYDQQTKRWFNVVLTLDIDPASGDFLGSNHLDIAVSSSPDPTGSWTIYRLPVQNDGTDGTPNHHCTVDGVNPGPCIGDYPHIGADANGFYITTNEYDFIGPAYQSANVYALSKAALAANAATVNVWQTDTKAAVASSRGAQPGFTVWPATSPASDSSEGSGKGKGGTEYFMSSNAADEATAPGGTSAGPGNSREIVVWSLKGTSTLNGATPSLTLSSKVLSSNEYAIPPKADQKPGDVPLADALNLNAFGFGSPPTPEVESVLDANDTRMQQVTFADGKLWGALDTALTVNGVNKAGVAWFVVDPSAQKVRKQGYVGLADNNLTYPAIGVTSEGRGVMAFTLVGKDHYPSAAYASIDSENGVGSIRVAAEGVGPQDGFSGYFIGGPRPRWGDYGATAVDGKSIWIASEYIAQTCTLAQYFASTSCGGTRVTLGNWATRISKVNP